METCSEWTCPFYLILIEIITLTFPGYSSSSPSMRESKDFTVPRDNLDFTVPRDNLGAPIYAAEREEHCRWPTVLINRTHSLTVLLTQMTYRPVHQDTQPSAEVDPLGPTVQIWELHRFYTLIHGNLVDYFVWFGGFLMVQTQPLLFKFVLFSSQSIKIK